MKIGSLFSGYGGLDLAVQAVFPTAEPAWFVEFDPAPSKILQHHYPNIPNFGDVTTINWEQLAQEHPIDILTGGYPCQPFSQAGKRKGVHDERHLWPHVRKAIRHLRPRFTFLENVAGHRSLGFDRVLADMAEDGLHVRWCSLRASDVGGHTTANEYSFLLPTPTASDWKRADSPGDHRRSTPGLTSVSVYFAHAETKYSPAIRHWETATRPAPSPTVLNKNGKPQLNTMFTEWLMGLPAG